jgi:hypothetical protein
MDHKDALNRLLSNACPMTERTDEDGCDEYLIELHCINYVIKARYLGWNDKKVHGEYEIINMAPVQGVKKIPTYDAKLSKTTKTTV